MEETQDWLAHLELGLAAVKEFVWGPFLLVPLLLLTGLYLTIRLRGLQFRVLWHALWLAYVRREEKGNVPGDVSHYQALSTALAATVGVGNIAGVAIALGTGGPGALFWMWMTGLVGMATKYSEALLGVKYRRTDARGEQTGGPMNYLAFGVGGRFGKVLGVTFAVFGVVASFGIGNMVQANTAADQLFNTWAVDRVQTGLFLTIAVAVVILGGIRSIGRFAAAVVPLMIVLYVACCLAVLVVFADRLPEALMMVFRDAFTGSAATGGFLGASVLIAVQMGVARGIFSNESGMGTGAIAAAAAKTDQPVRQAMVSMTQTFTDTLVVVTMTALAVIVTGAWAEPGLRGSPMTAWALGQGFGGGWGLYVVTIGVLVYAYTTILGWSYYGERCSESLWGVKAVWPYRVVFTLMVFGGCVLSLDAVWTFSDIANGLMALPNLIGLLLLSGVVVRETQAYMSRKDWKRLD